MRIPPALTPALLVFPLLLSSCGRNTGEIPEEEPLPEAVVLSDPDTIVLEDQSGAKLTLNFGGRPKAYLSAGATTDFSVPVRIRFQGGEADAHFRESTEMGPDEEDYWTFDDEKGRFEVGSTIAFLRSLAEADRLFLEIKLSDQERKALVFDLAEAQRGILASKLDENSSRVDNELRALGLGPYAPKTEPREEKPDHLKVEVDDEALYFLYDEYINVVAKLTRENIFPAPTPQDNQAMAAMNPFCPVSSAFAYYARAYPQSMAAAERLALDAGFETVDQWRSIGDRLQLGMIVVGFEEMSPGFIASNIAFTPGEMTSFDEDKRKYAEVIRAFSEDELEWFARNRTRFLEATGS